MRTRFVSLRPLFLALGVVLAACEPEDECSSDDDCVALSKLPGGVPNTKCFMPGSSSGTLGGIPVSVDHRNYCSCFATDASKAIRDTCTEVDPSMECVQEPGLTTMSCAKK